MINDPVRGVLRILQAYHQGQMQDDPEGHHEGMLFKIERLLSGQDEKTMLQLDRIWRQVSPEFTDKADAVNSFTQLVAEKLDEPPVLDAPQHYSGLI